MKMKDIKKIAVIGAGTMGHGIAQSFAQAGYQVNLRSRTTQTLDRAMALINGSLNSMVKADLLERKTVPEILSRINRTTSLEDAAGDVDIALETMAEDKEEKRKAFLALDQICPPRTLLASNTTFLRIFDFVKTSRQDKVLIAHFYAPPQIIPLVDLVKGPETDMANVQLVADILRSMGKKPIIFKNHISGYVVSRLQFALQREIHYLLDNGYLTPREVDDAAIWGLAMRMMVVGVVGRIDFGGLDLSVKNLKSASCPPTPLDYQPTMIVDLAEKGCLGVKTGRGFYDFGGMSEAKACEIRDDKLLKMLKFYQTLGDALPSGTTRQEEMQKAS